MQGDEAEPGELPVPASPLASGLLLPGCLHLRAMGRGLELCIGMIHLQGMAASSGLYIQAGFLLGCLLPGAYCISAPGHGRQSTDIFAGGLPLFLFEKKNEEAVL